MERLGEVKEKDEEEIKEGLGSEEKIILITEKKGGKAKEKQLLALTNRRVIFQKRERKKILKETEKYKDFPYSSITSIKIEPKKNYGVFRIKTKGKETESIIIPKNKGKEIAGRLRQEQTRLKRKAKS